MNVSSENIEQARQLLLQEIYCENADERYTRREAIKQLLAPLLAARQSGMSFDKITILFQKVGLALSAKTLERYYYTLKSDEELAKEARQHAQKIRQLRQELRSKSLKMRQEQANKLAVQFAANRSLNKVCNDGENCGEHGQDVAPSNSSKAVKLSAPIMTVEAPPPSKRLNGASSSGAPVVSTKQITARTIDQIAEDSLADNARTVIQADLEVRDQQQVFYANGSPFIGTLTKKQIHLLRTTGRLIASSSGKSSKDFVAMRAQI